MLAKAVTRIKISFPKFQVKFQFEESFFFLNLFQYKSILVYLLTSNFKGVNTLWVFEGRKQQLSLTRLRVWVS